LQTKGEHHPRVYAAMTAIKAALEAKDEPVAWMVYTQEGQSAFVTDNPAVIHPSQRALPLYATPQRTWVGLTDEEAQKSFAEHNCDISTHLAGILARAIEAKLREKNNA
jgi:hypothetical protein